MKLMFIKGAVILSSCLALSAYAIDPSQYGVQAAPLPSSCSVNVDCLVSSTHFAAVINKTNLTKNILVVYEICPEGEICNRAQYKIMIPPMGTWKDTKNMTKVSKYHFGGTRTFTAMTMLIDQTTRRNLAETRQQGMTRVYG